MSTAIRTSIIVLLILHLGSVPGAESPPQQAPDLVSLEAISKAMAKAEVVFTGFTQERHLSLFEEPLRCEGYLCFEKPNRVRWEITSPYQSILVSDGKGVAQFEWVDEQWKRLELGVAEAMQQVVAQIAAVMEGRYARDQRAYDVSVKNSAEGPVVTLAILQEMMRKMMVAIEVHLAPDLKSTRRVVLRETGGDYTDIRFSKQVIGLVLPKGTFDRNAPADLEQIRRAAETQSSRP